MLIHFQSISKLFTDIIIRYYHDQLTYYIFYHKLSKIIHKLSYLINYCQVSSTYALIIHHQSIIFTDILLSVNNHNESIDHPSVIHLLPIYADINVPSMPIFGGCSRRSPPICAPKRRPKRHSLAPRRDWGVWKGTSPTEWRFRFRGMINEKIMRTSLEDHVNIMLTPWENHGKIMGTSSYLEVNSLGSSKWWFSSDIYGVVMGDILYIICRNTCRHGIVMENT